MMRRSRRAVAGAGVVALTLALSGGLATTPAMSLSGIQKIQHVIVITQENRSFDNYFGTYPGANGIPAGVCDPDPLHGGCVAPFHDGADVNYGGPHHVYAYLRDLDGGKMDGFVAEAEQGLGCTTTPNAANCSPCKTSATATACVDVMGYHDAREIPNYWTYAENFVLQDAMFTSTRGWSWPTHLWEVSGWSAQCSVLTNPLTCTTFFNQPATGQTGTAPDSLPWTDITYLLYTHNVSWAYYVFKGTEPDCESDAAMTCAPVKQGPTTPGIWNPLLYFRDVYQDNQAGNIQSLSSFHSALGKTGACGLPNVSWVVPNGNVSEHPPSPISAGQAFVTTTINAVMKSPCWSSSAIFLSWDDWGGFYDHVVPPTVLTELEGGGGPAIAAGYGFRVPGLVISPYAKVGYIDHQILSSDAYLKFIEDDFLGGEPICAPATNGTNQGCTTNDGRPDSRPQVSESLVPGDLVNDFNFNQSPRPPLILPTHPAPGPASCAPGAGAAGSSCGVSGVSDWQLTVSVSARQRLRGHRPAVVLVVGCDIACHVGVTASLSLSRRGPVIKLRSRGSSLAAGRSWTLRLGLTPRTLRKVRAALGAHKRVTARLVVRGRAAGVTRRYSAAIVLLR